MEKENNRYLTRLLNWYQANCNGNWELGLDKRAKLYTH